MEQKKKLPAGWEYAAKVLEFLDAPEELLKSGDSEAWRDFLRNKIYRFRKVKTNA